jgi:hypothetical protein
MATKKRNTHKVSSTLSVPVNRGKKSVQIAVSGTRRRKTHHTAPKRHKRRKVSGFDSGVIEQIAYGVAGGLIARVVSHTVQNSTTLGLKGKSYTDYVVPALSIAGAAMLKNQIAKKLAIGAAVVSVAEIVNESKLPQLISGLPQTVGNLPQTVGRTYQPVQRRIMQRTQLNLPQYAQKRLNGTPVTTNNPSEGGAGNRSTEMPIMFGGGSVAAMGAIYTHY